jgi:hypothetical protein
VNAESLDLPPDMHDAAQEVDVLDRQAEGLALPQAQPTPSVSQRLIPARGALHEPLRPARARDAGRSKGERESGRPSATNR